MKAEKWDLKAWIHDPIFKLPLLESVKKEEKEIFNDLISDEAPRGGKIMDIGCGTGEFTQFLLNNNIIFGVDISLKMITKARNKLPGVNFIKADVLHLPFKTASMDFVSMVGLLEYFKDQRRPLIEALRILGDDGRMVVSFSKKSFLNLPRKIWGINYFTLSEKKIINILETSELIILKKREGRIQTQILCKKKH